MTFLSNFNNINFSRQSTPSLKASRINIDIEFRSKLNKKLHGKEKEHQLDILQENLKDFSKDEIFDALILLNENPFDLDYINPFDTFLNSFLKKTITLIKQEESKGAKNIKKLLHFTKLFKNIDEETTNKIFNEVRENIKKLDIEDFIIAPTTIDASSCIYYIGNTKIIGIERESLITGNSKKIAYILGHEITHWLLFESPTFCELMPKNDLNEELQDLESIEKREKDKIDSDSSKILQIKQKLLIIDDEKKFLNLFKKIDKLNKQLNEHSKLTQSTQKKVNNIYKIFKSNHFEELLCDEGGTLIVSLFLSNKKLKLSENFYPDINLVTEDKNIVYTHPNENVRNALTYVSFRKLAKKNGIARNIFNEYDKKLKVIAKDDTKCKSISSFEVEDANFFETFKDDIVDIANGLSLIRIKKYISLLDKKLKENPCMINKRFMNNTLCFDNLNRFFCNVSEILKYNASKLKVTNENKKNILRICENKGLGILLLVDKKDYFQDIILTKAQKSFELIENINNYLYHNRESSMNNRLCRNEIVRFNVTPENLPLCVNLLKNSIWLNLRDNHILNLFDKPGAILEALYNECAEKQDLSLFRKIQYRYKY